MAVEQIVEVPESRRLTIEVPRNVPPGKTILTFTPVSIPDNAANSPNIIEDAVREAEKKAGAPDYIPFKGLGGSLKDSPRFGGSGIALQKKLRAEWETING